MVGLSFRPLKANGHILEFYRVFAGPTNPDLSPSPLPIAEVAGKDDHHEAERLGKRCKHRCPFCLVYLKNRGPWFT